MATNQPEPLILVRSGPQWVHWAVAVRSLFPCGPIARPGPFVRAVLANPAWYAVRLLLYDARDEG